MQEQQIQQIQAPRIPPSLLYIARVNMDMARLVKLLEVHMKVGDIQEQFVPKLGNFTAHRSVHIRVNEWAPESPMLHALLSGEKYKIAYGYSQKIGELFMTVVVNRNPEVFERIAKQKLDEIAAAAAAATASSVSAAAAAHWEENEERHKRQRYERNPRPAQEEFMFQQEYRFRQPLPPLHPPPAQMHAELVALRSENEALRRENERLHDLNCKLKMIVGL